MFRFREFVVNQDNAAMKVGTDGILLGAWSTVPRNGKALDIGTGTGLLALMCAQRSTRLQITGLEKDGSASLQAIKNAAESPWANRIEIVHTALLDFSAKCRFDLIISNPPFYHEAIRTGDRKRDGARWNGHLPFSTLLASCNELLRDNGVLSIIVPFQAKAKVIKMASWNGLYPCRIAHVKNNEPGRPYRCLLEFRSHFSRPEMENIVQFIGGNARSRRFNELIKPFLLQ